MLVAMAGCADEPPARPNIVIVVLDTVRDDVPALADDGLPDPMPNLRALADGGTVFTNAWATAPWTLPSHASMMTGLLSSGHLCTGHSPVLDGDLTTFAELLSDSGYESVAFFSNPWLTDEMSGVMRGFRSRYVESRGDDRIHSLRGSQGGAASNANIAQWLSERGDDSPFLLFVNYLETHLPYDPSPEVRASRLPDLSPDEIITTRWAYEFNAGVHAAEEVDWDRVNRLYVGDAATSDALLGELVSMLDERGLSDDTVIIATSDHGENLGEHGLMDHQFGVYETLLAVPLVVKAPTLLEPGRRDDPVMLTDVFPTVLDIAGLEVPCGLGHARSLLGPPASADRPLIAEYAGGRPALIQRLREMNPELDASPYATAYSTVRVGNLRLTVGSDGSHRLDDYATDSDEMLDLEAEGRAVARTLKALLPGVVRPARDIEVSEELEEELRSLGYMP
jgi:arylsulfatase A-like enzyme